MTDAHDALLNPRGKRRERRCRFEGTASQTCKPQKTRCIINRAGHVARPDSHTCR